ncbi:MAG: alpha/beta hydrolase [Gemmatimonadetes bacterium]|nr:alpha/beta hydrolase [Gemmatimonadota bacterium]
MQPGRVSGLLLRPENARVLYVLAHGAGAGMRHPFLENVARALAGRGIATLRYQFPYLETGSRRPDPPWILEAVVRRAVETAAELAPGLPLLAGGKSMGGRMTSNAAARKPLEGVVGLVFLGFPLHPAGAPATTRAEHLQQIGAPVGQSGPAASGRRAGSEGRRDLPMLFLQGTRDALADATLMRDVCRRLGARATLHFVDGADHSFAVLKRSGRTAVDVLEELARTLDDWATRILAPAKTRGRGRSR